MLNDNNDFWNQGENFMKDISRENLKKMIEAAHLVRRRAYAPYSRFKVGASVMGKTGKIYAGCNVENASFGLTMCAERVAMGNAVACGETEIEGLVIVTEAPEPASPCGACRQVISEFAEDIPVILENLEGKRVKLYLKDLLPYQFDLKKGLK